MVTRALAKYLKISPKKLKPVASLLGRKKVADVLYMLVNVNKKGALMLKAVVESALSNAKRLPNKDFNEENLHISKVVVNAGPVLKRHRAMSMGRAGHIRKRTSHVLIELDSVKEKASDKANTVKKVGKEIKPAKKANVRKK